MRTMLVILFTAVLLTPAEAVVKKPSADKADLAKVEAFVKSNVNMVLDLLRDKKMDEKERKDKVMGVVNPLFDFPLMAKLVLGRDNWPKFKKPQRAEFTDLFVAQLRGSYVEKLDLLTDEEVEFGKPKRSGSKFSMVTHILSKGQRYKMLYKLYKKKSELKVYDVELEGISIVKSYSSQYDQFLRKGTVPDLLEKMRRKTVGEPKELEKKKASEGKAEAAGKEKKG